MSGLRKPGSPARVACDEKQQQREIYKLQPSLIFLVGSRLPQVDRLLEKGLVSRVESTEDQRVRILALTRAAKTHCSSF